MNETAAGWCQLRGVAVGDSILVKGGEGARWKRHLVTAIGERSILARPEKGRFEIHYSTASKLRTVEPPAKKEPGERLWVLYDGRSRGGVGTDGAGVLVSAQSEKEIRKDARMFEGQDFACYSYRIEEGKTLEDERWEFDS